jgi:DNA invertase Pin-like site-specific DNA recombinase
VLHHLVVSVHGEGSLTGNSSLGPGLREALAAVRAGDTLVVSKLDRLARSLPDARDIADELTAKGVSLSLGGSTYDPADPVGRLLFNVLGMVAEFEADLICRAAEALAVALRRRRAHAGRACRAVQRLPNDGLPRDPAPRRGDEAS